MPLRIPHLDSQHHQIDRVEVLIGQPVGEVPVGLERRMDAHRFRGGEELHDETMLHQGLSAADRHPSRHDLQAGPVFPQLLGRSRDRDRNTVRHRPGVGVVAIETAPHAAGCPCDDSHAGTVDGRSGGEGVQESHLARRECTSNVRVRNIPAEVDAQLVRALRRQRRLHDGLLVRHWPRRGTSG